VSRSDSPAGTWLRQAAAVFVKEWRTELRTRYALNTLGLFAFTTLVVVSLVLGPVGTAPEMARAVLPVILWLILLFAVTAGLPRLFVTEEETHTATALRLSARPSALFAGKVLYGFTVVLVLEALTAPLFAALTQLTVLKPGLLAAALVAGGYGLSVTSTLVAAMVAQARSQGALFAVLLMPLTVPALLLAVELTRMAVGGTDPGNELTLLLLYDGALSVAGLMLFPAVWAP
jgi:heme exporter protein B